MSENESERDVRIAQILEQARLELRSLGTINVAGLQTKNPDLADELPELLETLNKFDSAVRNWQMTPPPEETQVIPPEVHPGNREQETLTHGISQIGRYRVVRVLGRGGMGIVYMAHDPQLQRTVAVKVPHFEGPLAVIEKSRQRFLREARAAATIRHPNVCPIYDVGEDADTSFIVMAYVEGPSLADFLAENGRFEDCREAVRLIRQVAEGLSAVHECGLIHRDLKPGNILLTKDRSQILDAVLTDFGLARAVEDSEHLTVEGFLVGTPAFMAPEQATGKTVSQATDVYGLSVILYKMLTDHLPFEGQPMTILYKIEHETPPQASAHRPGLDPKLEAIIRKGMAKRPEDRYRSARAFADALGAWLVEPPGSSDAPTELALTVSPSIRPAASPPRRRAWIAAAGGLFLLIAGVLVAQQIIIQFRDDKGNIKKVELPPGANDAAIIQPPLAKIPQGERLSPSSLVSKPAKIDGVHSWTIETIGYRGHVIDIAWTPDGKRFASGGHDGVVRIWEPTTGKLTAAFLVFPKPLVGENPFGYINKLAWSPDGKTLAVGSSLGRVQLWDSMGRPGLALEKPRTGSPIADLAWSHDSKKLAVCDLKDSDNKETSFRVYDTTSGERLHTLNIPNHAGVPARADWSPDDKTLATAACGREVVFLWDMPAGKLREKIILGEQPFSVNWSPDGKLLAAGKKILGSVPRKDGMQIIHDLAKDGIVDSSGHWSVDSKTYTAVLRGGVARTWDAVSGKLLSTPTEGGKGLVSAIFAWSPDGKSLAMAGGDLRQKKFPLQVWDVGTPEARILNPGLASYARLALSPDGKTLITTYQSEFTDRVWDAVSGKPNENENLRSVLQWSADSSRALIFDSIPRIADVATGKNSATFKDLLNSRQFLWSPNGKLVAGTDGKSLHLCDAETGKLLRTSPLEAPFYHTWAWSPDGKWIAGGSEDSKVRLVAPITTRPRPDDKDIVLETAAGPIPSVAWSPDGKQLAVSQGAGGIEIWDIPAVKSVRRFADPAESHPPYRLAWSPDGKTIAAQGGSTLETVSLWDVATGKLLHKNWLPSTLGWADNHLSFFPDSKTLAVASNAMIHYLDVKTGESRGGIITLRNGGIAISPDGHYRGPASASSEIVYVIRTERGQETLFPSDFAKTYGWKNDPDRVRLTGE